MKYFRTLTCVLAVCAISALIPSYAGAKDVKPADNQKKEAQKENPWVMKKDKDGIKVFIRNVEGISFKEFRGIMDVDAPIGSVEKVIADVPNQVNWLCDTIESKVIKEDPISPIQYNVITAPLVSNRDVIIQTRIIRTPGKVTRLFQGIQMDSVPMRKGIVRMPRMAGMWLLESLDKNKTRVTYQNLADPGGSLPSGLVNMTVVKMPFISLNGLREQLKNPKYNK